MLAPIALKSRYQQAISAPIAHKTYTPTLPKTLAYSANPDRTRKVILAGSALTATPAQVTKRSNVVTIWYPTILMAQLAVLSAAEARTRKAPIANSAKAELIKNSLE